MIFTILFIVSIIEEEEKLYKKIYYSNKNIIDTNYALFQMFK